MTAAEITFLAEWDRAAKLDAAGDFARVRDLERLAFPGSRAYDSAVHGWHDEARSIAKKVGPLEGRTDSWGWRETPFGSEVLDRIRWGAP